MQEQYWIRQDGGGVQGPFPLAKTLRYISDQRAKPTMEYSTDGGATWRRGHECQELFGAASAPPGPPPLPPAARTSRGQVRSGSRRRTPVARQEPRRSSKKKWLLIGVGAFIFMGIVGQACDGDRKAARREEAPTPSTGPDVSLPLAQHAGQTVAVYSRDFMYWKTGRGRAVDAAPFLPQRMDPDDAFPGVVEDIKATHMSWLRSHSVGLICFQWNSKLKPDEFGRERGHAPNFWALLSLDTIERIQRPREVSPEDWLSHIVDQGDGRWSGVPGQRTDAETGRDLMVGLMSTESVGRPMFSSAGHPALLLTGQPSGPPPYAIGQLFEGQASHLAGAAQRQFLLVFDAECEAVLELHDDHRVLRDLSLQERGRVPVTHRLRRGEWAGDKRTVYRAADQVAWEETTDKGVTIWACSLLEGAVNRDAAGRVTSVDIGLGVVWRDARPDGSKPPRLDEAHTFVVGKMTIRSGEAALQWEGPDARTKRTDRHPRQTTLAVGVFEMHDALIGANTLTEKPYDRAERERKEGRRRREEAGRARKKREAEDERRREEQEKANRKAEMARFSAAVPGVYRAAHVPGSYIGFGDETDLRYELVLGADGAAGAALFVRGRVKWKASGTWGLIGAIRHSGRGLRISFKASDFSVRLPTRIEAGARWSEAQDAPLFGRGAGQDRPAGVYRIQGPFFGQDLQPVELVRTADAPSSVATADPEVLAYERRKQAAGKYVPTDATAKTLRAKYRGRVSYRLTLKKDGKFSLYYDIPRAKAVRMSGTWNWDGTTLTLRATKGNGRTLRRVKVDRFSFDGTTIDMDGIMLVKN